jgi:hypothetical protein
MYMRKTLATVISIWCLHYIILSKVTPRYVVLFSRGMFRPISCSTSSGTLKSSGEIDRLRFPFINLMFQHSHYDFAAVKPRCSLQRTRRK